MAKAKKAAGKPAKKSGNDKGKPFKGTKGRMKITRTSGSMTISRSVQA